MVRSKNPSLWHLVCVVTMAAALALTGAETYDEETKAALEEMSKLLRHLFPLIPDKAQYFWRTSHLGGSMVLRNDGRLQQIDQDGTNAGATESKQGWRSQSTPNVMLKRGPECMRRCIDEGILHPVQCHSLC